MSWGGQAGGRRWWGRARGGGYGTSGAGAGPVGEGVLRTFYLNDLTVFGATNRPRGVFAGLVSLMNAARIRPLRPDLLDALPEGPPEIAPPAAAPWGWTATRPGA